MWKSVGFKLGDNYHFPTEPPCWPQADTFEARISSSWPPLVPRSSTGQYWSNSALLAQPTAPPSFHRFLSRGSKAREPLDFLWPSHVLFFFQPLTFLL